MSRTESAPSTRPLWGTGPLLPAPPPTFEWHLRLGLQEEPLAARDPGLPNVIAQGVAPVGPAVKAASLVKHLHVFAPIAGDLLLAVPQGVNKEMN